MKKLGLLGLVLVLSLAVVGAGYAKWTDSVHVDGTVASGDLSWRWVPWTLDDKDFDWDPDYPDLGGDWTAQWDGMHLAGVTRVPEGKEVATTTFGFADMNADGDMEVLNVTVDNAYPWYYNKINLDVHCNGSVPLKFQKMIITINGQSYDVFANSFIEIDMNGDGSSDMLLHWGYGYGYQLHYCTSHPIEFGFLILEDEQLPPPQGLGTQGGPDAFEFGIEMIAVQWNEYQNPYETT